MILTGNKSILLAIINWLYLLTFINAMMPKSDEKSWIYEIKSSETTSSQPDLLNIDLKVERVSRGVYSLSGTFHLDFDIIEGDDTEVEAASFRSDNGANEYKTLPFKMPRQHIFKALDSFYKDLIMDGIKECSDLPVFEDKFEPPFEKKTYTLDKCQFSQDGFPNHLQDGFYKILISGYGTVEWTITLIVQVEKKY